VPYKYQGASQTELVTNSGFDTDTDWTKNTGWTISGGKGVATSAVNVKVIYQIISGLVPGKKYRVTYTISTLTAGAFNFRMYNTDNVGTTRSSTGTYTEEVTCPSDGRIDCFFWYWSSWDYIRNNRRRFTCPNRSSGRIRRFFNDIYKVVR